MTPYTAFLDYVLPDAPGCTNELAVHAIKNTVIEFCEKSLILQVDHDPVTIVAGQVDYDLEPPRDTLIVKIQKVFYKEYEIEPMSPDEVMSASLYNRNFPDANPEKGPPKLYTQKDARTFSVYPVPQDTERLALTLRVALKPTRSATQIDDLIFEEYAETIGNGAISRLCLSPKKPYTNPQIAAIKQAQFAAGLNVARQRANRGYVRSKEQVVLRKI
jgi:hypothetical protein